MLKKLEAAAKPLLQWEQGKWYTVRLQGGLGGSGIGGLEEGRPGPSG